MSTPKHIKVPTELIEAMSLLASNKLKKQNTPKIQVHVKKPVIYKMISTEEWLKKEEAKKAKEARIKAFHEKPKSDATIKAYVDKEPKINKFKQGTKEYSQEYYFRNKERLTTYCNEYYHKNKERLKAYRRQRYLKLKKAKINPSDEPLQTSWHTKATRCSRPRIQLLHQAVDLDNQAIRARVLLVVI